MNKDQEINEFVFNNFDYIQYNMVNMYKEYYDLVVHEPDIFIIDITKQFMNRVHNFLLNYLLSKLNITFTYEDIIIYIKDKFTFDNIERIISDRI